VSISLPRPAFYALLGLLASALILLVLLPLYVYRRRYLDELEKRQQLQETKRQLAESREDERRQLARELHDGPLQDLHALHMQLGIAADSLTARPGRPVTEDATTESAGRRVRGAQDDAQTVVDDLRRITEELRPPALGPFGLAAALSAHADRFGRRYPGLSIHLALDADGLTLPESTRLALFRIAQEAMNNAVKHGPPLQIGLTLDMADAEVRLTVEDDGPGLVTAPDLMALAMDGHFGLLGMQERADSVSGTLQVHNRAQGGLRVHVTAPRTPNPTR
jgi:signal transduction histidine kinase